MHQPAEVAIDFPVTCSAEPGFLVADLKHMAAECLFSELSTLGTHSRYQLGLTWDQGDSVIAVTFGSFCLYQSLNLCGAGCTVVCFVRLYLCLSHAPVYLWGSLMPILRCFGPLHPWCQPRSVPRRSGRSTGHCHAYARCSPPHPPQQEWEKEE